MHRHTPHPDRVPAPPPAPALPALPAVALAALLLSACASSSMPPGNNAFVGGDVGFVTDSGVADAGVTDGGSSSGADAVSGGDAKGSGGDTGSSPGDGGSGADSGATDAGPTCQSTCGTDGERKCIDSAAWQICQDLEDDGCFDWSPSRNCGPGELCQDGQCTKKCPDQPCTTVGAKKCDPDGAIVECFDFDKDGCLEWGNPVSCPKGQVCSGGFCALSCKDECTTVGARKCDGNKVVSCGDSDSDGCLDWGKALDCGNQICSGGFCADKCKSTCTTKDAKKCDSGGIAVCGDYNKDGCLEWGTPKQCDKGTTCSAGECLQQCKNECTAIGAKKCDDAGKVTACGDYNSDGCLEWGTGVACAEGLVCDGGFCANKCSNQCTVSGARKCDEAGKVSTCGDYNKDGCLEWGSATACAPGTVCSGNGICSQKCSNACDVAKTRQCVAGQTGQYQVCGDYNNDGCLEWGSAVACGEGQACSKGNCAATCASTCTGKGDKQCKNGAVEVCGDYNSDGCLEWGTPKACELFQLCVEGACKHKPIPAKVVINELLYDSAGADTGTFVELYGPPGTALAGWTLAGVNGANGATYNVIELSGVIPADGFFVVAHTKAPAWVAKNADMKSDLTDYQQSPDSVQLLFGTKVVDALAYGKFGAKHTRAGEGNPAPDGSAGQSLGRDGKQTDTDDNAKDFKLYNEPTPGAPNLVGNKPPSAKIQCPQGGTPGQKLAFDAGGSSDPDGKIASWAFDFGDGAKAASTDGKASHAYAKAGTYTVKVTVKDDKGEPDSASCVLGIAKPNKPPVAALKCPAQVGVGKPALLDGSGSKDADGVVKVWSFDFGDGSAPQSGAKATVTHAWTKAGVYTVKLTVTDDGGAKHGTSCKVSVSDATPPTVVIIKPAGTKQVTQGDKVPILVDATPAKGKKIKLVEVFAGTESLGTTSAAPYQFGYTVPAAAKTGSTIKLVAKAKDDAGAVGQSKAVDLLVRNDKPVAKFSAVVSGKLKVVMDASSSSDTETPTKDLEVRWDFTDDGTWDTPWSKTKLQEHAYPKDGKYTIRVQVKDAVGQVAEATRSVTLSSISYVGGKITTTTWTGIIVVSGDVTVPANNTLTIGKGTQVLVVWADQNKDGRGDYRITINGRLVVQGDAQDPVVFTSQSKDNKKPGKGWDAIYLQGQGSTIRGAVIEYANVGLFVADSSSVNNTTLRFNRTGARITGKAKATFTDVTAQNNIEDGVNVTSPGSLAIKGGVYSDNGRDGIGTSGSGAGATLNADGATVERNKQTGIRVRGLTRGLITHCNIHSNAYEGLRIEALESYDPTIAARVNNISENSDVGARVIASVSLTATSSKNSVSSASSSPWTAPKGAVVEMARWSFSENDYYKYNLVRGRILNAANGGQLRESSGSRPMRWADISPGRASAIRAQVYESGSNLYRSYWGETRIRAVAYRMPGAVAEVSVVTNSARIDLRHNWLGTFPSVHKVVQLAHPDAANLHGFVGKAYGSTWDSGPYYGGTTFAKDVSWSGEVWITGDLTVPAGRSLNIAAGTRVRVVRFDQDHNGKGDFRVEIAGKLNIQGAEGKEVVFSMYGPNKSTDAWDVIRVRGSQSAATVSRAIFEYGRVCLELDSGVHVIRNSIFRHCGNEGLYISAANNVKITDTRAHDNGTYGYHAYNSTGVVIDGGRVESNQLSGVRGSSSTMTVRNLYINKNGGAGIRADDGTTAIAQCSIKSNGLGVWFRRAAKGTLTRSDIQYNQGEGIFLSSDSVRSPSPKITYNNILGNSVTAGGVYQQLNLAAKSSGSNVSSVAGPPWKTPKGERVVYARVSYNESDYYKYNLVRGRLQTDGGATLRTMSGTTSLRWYDLAGDFTAAVGVRPYVYETGSNLYRGYWGETHVSGAFYRTANVLKELSAVTDSGTIDCTHNHWGMKPKKDPKDPNEIQFPYLGQEVLLKLTLSRSDAVNIQNAQGPINNTGPQ